MITFSKFGNYGRLGNQMFQYATLKYISLRKNFHLFLPLNENNKLANAFNIKSHYYNSYEQIAGNIKNSFKEKQFNFDSSIFDSQDNSDFEGYFQSEKYFKDIKHILLKDFTLRNNSITLKAEEVIQQIKKDNNKEVVSFHIRRGDNVPSGNNYATPDGAQYLTNKQDFHPLLSNDFLNSAPKNFPNCVFVICSDSPKDMEWCKENIKLEQKCYFIGGNNDLYDFELMKQSDHNIIANSSFSWWAAWLNENKDKQVVAPSKWFGKMYSNHDLTDLLPKDWKVI